MDSPTKVFGVDELTLNVRYHSGRGRMTINLPEYLASMPLSHIRKLKRIIESSDTPEELEKITAYIAAELQSFDGRMRDMANRAVNANTTVKELQPELERLIALRDKYKRNSPPYKEIMLRVKAKREEISHHRAVYHSSLSEFNRLSRSKEKFSKV